MTIFETHYQIRLLTHPSSNIFFENEISQVISEAKFQSDEGPINLLVDWNAAIENYFQYDPFLSIPCKVQSHTDHIGPNDYYIEYFLHQVFLALNLSSPGCCTFHGTTIHRDDSPEVWKTSLNLNGYSGTPYTLSSGDLWPVISFIPLADTWYWLQSLNPGMQQIAQTRVEKALFAMLYVSKDDDLNPGRLIWLAHALEALFDTPELGISKALKSRIFLVLGKPASHSKKIKGAIDSFYKLRSSFVHGGLDIAHPLGNPALHQEIDKFENRILKEANLAISIIWATLQLFVHNNWKEIEFSESFVGHSL